MISETGIGINNLCSKGGPVSEQPSNFSASHINTVSSVLDKTAYIKVVNNKKFGSFEPARTASIEIQLSESTLHRFRCIAEQREIRFADVLCRAIQNGIKQMEVDDNA